jgi:hypothetical protein
MLLIMTSPLAARQCPSGGVIVELRADMRFVIAHFGVAWHGIPRSGYVA